MNNWKYDVILCSEGIYKVESFKVLAKLLVAKLTRSGVALFSAKRFYFGCGGGTREFMKYIERGEDGMFGDLLQCEVVQTFDNKKSNVREILKIKRKVGLFNVEVAASGKRK